MNAANGRSYSRTAFGFAPLILATLVCPTLAAQPTTSTGQVQTFDTAIMSELIAIVGQHGWRANMGRMCAAFKLGRKAIAASSKWR
jgi:hypothetical protein